MSQRYEFACDNPNALEFGKCHKQENNSGCSGCPDPAGGDVRLLASYEFYTPLEESGSDQTVVRKKLTRGDFA